MLYNICVVNNIFLSCTIYFSIKNNFNTFYTSVPYDFFILRRVIHLLECKTSFRFGAKIVEGRR